MSDILLIEDDEAIRELLKAHMLKAGHTVREAENGHIGLEMVHAQAPDLIILDINMPIMDGTRTMKALDDDPRTKAVPVIALSAVNVPEMRDDMHALGCDAFVTKPINFDTLCKKVAELTAG